LYSYFNETFKTGLMRLFSFKQTEYSSTKTTRLNRKRLQIEIKLNSNLISSQIWITH